MIKIDIYYFLTIMIINTIMTKFVIKLNILQMKKRVLQIVLIIILQESELIHMIL